MEEEEEIAGFLVALKTLGLEEAEIERQFQVFVDNPSLREKLRDVVRETLRDRIHQLEDKKQHRRKRKNRSRKRARKDLPPVRVRSGLYDEEKRKPVGVRNI